MNPIVFCQACSTRAAVQPSLLEKQRAPHHWIVQHVVLPTRDSLAAQERSPGAACAEGRGSAASSPGPASCGSRRSAAARRSRRPLAAGASSPAAPSAAAAAAGHAAAWRRGTALLSAAASVLLPVTVVESVCRHRVMGNDGQSARQVQSELLPDRQTLHESGPRLHAKGQLI